MMLRTVEDQLGESENLIEPHQHEQAQYLFTRNNSINQLQPFPSGEEHSIRDDLLEDFTERASIERPTEKQALASSKRDSDDAQLAFTEHQRQKKQHSQKLLLTFADSRPTVREPPVTKQKQKHSQPGRPSKAS